jgi:hypothetical protein
MFLADPRRWVSLGQFLADGARKSDVFLEYSPSVKAVLYALRNKERADKAQKGDKFVLAAMETTPGLSRSRFSKREIENTCFGVSNQSGTSYASPSIGRTQQLQSLPFRGLRVITSYRPIDELLGGHGLEGNPAYS